MNEPLSERQADERLESARLAAKKWQALLDSDPHNQTALWRLAEALIDLGRFDEGERLLIGARQRWPESILPVALLSRLYERQRRFSWRSL